MTGEGPGWGRPTGGRLSARSMSAASVEAVILTHRWRARPAGEPELAAAAKAAAGRGARRGRDRRSPSQAARSMPRAATIHAVVAVCGRYALPRVIPVRPQGPCWASSRPWPARPAAARPPRRPPMPRLPRRTGAAGARRPGGVPATVAATLARGPRARAARVVVRDRTGQPSVWRRTRTRREGPVSRPARNLFPRPSAVRRVRTLAISPPVFSAKCGFFRHDAVGASDAAVSFAPSQSRKGIKESWTKSDFVDQVASASGLSTRMRCCVDAVPRHHRNALKSGGRGLLHGLRQVPRRPARRPRGPQPAYSARA
jgi:hypothetical protein